jgi:branched-chain amino acid transport system substrate-binding protein
VSHEWTTVHAAVAGVDNLRNPGVKSANALFAQRAREALGSVLNSSSMRGLGSFGQLPTESPPRRRGKMKRRSWSLVAACVASLALVVSACGGGDEAAAPEETPATETQPADTGAPAETAAAETGTAETGAAAPAGEPIVLGVAGSLSGPLAPWGLLPMRLAELAVEDINAAGGLLGRPVELVSADDKSDFAANGAATAIEVIDKGAVAVITDCDFDWSAPAQTEATSRGVPAISFCAGAPQFGPNGLGPLTFSAGIATPNEASVPAEWAYEDQGWRNAFVLNDPVIAYDTTYCDSFAARWEQLGGTVVGSDTFENEDPQLGPVITRMQGSDPQPDFIMLCSIPPAGATAIRQIRAAGIDIPIIMNTGNAGDWWFDQLGAPLDNAYQSTYGSWKGDDEIAKINELAERYQEKYGEPIVQPHTFMGYQVVELLADAITRAGSTDGQAIADALAQTEGDFLIGRHTIDPDYNHSFTLPVTIMKIENSEASFLTRRQPTGDARALWEENVVGE